MQLIEGYLAESLSEQEAEEFEKHYLECEDCFSALQMQHAVRLEAGPAGKTLARFPESGQRRIMVPRRWLLPLAATIVLLVFPLSLWITHDWGQATNLPPRLLQIESLPAYVETTVRGGQAGSSLELFRKGMEAYQRQDYQGAINGLEQAQAGNPDHLPTAFYLGLSHLVLDHSETAAEQLRRVVAAWDTPYLEEARWYLAKACFRLGQVQAGREQLEAIQAMDGAYAQDAAQALALLKRGQD